MKISFKSVLNYSVILLIGICNINSAQWQNNNFGIPNNQQFNNHNMQFNNNINMHNNFNNNNINMQQFLINDIKTRKDGISINWNSVNKADWKLFQSNITKYPSARTNAIRALRFLLVGNGAQNFHGDSQSNEFTYRLQYAQQIGGLINFYSSNFNTTEKTFTSDPAFELVTMIANYYLIKLSNGYDISTIQNNLPILSPQAKAYLSTVVLNNYNYWDYYKNYYLHRIQDSIKYGINNSNSFLVNNITVEQWNSAVQMIKRIDLAGCLKKMIRGVNVATYFECYRKNPLATNNKQVNLSNGVGKCAFNTMYQLLSTSLYKLKQYNTISPLTTGYFADFDKYLRQKQQHNYENPLNLIAELWNFEKNLSQEDLNTWNNTDGVKDAKNKLKNMQNIYSNESFITVLDIFSKIFPELKELNNDFMLNVIVNNTTSEQFFKLNTSNDYILFSGTGNSGFANIGNSGIAKNILFNNINENQYMISFDKQGHLFIYELTGLQLSAPGHNIAYAKYDNSNFNWRVVDSAGTSSTYGMQLHGIFQNNNFEYLKNYAGVAAYMFKKVSNQEFLYYMPQSLVL